MRYLRLTVLTRRLAENEGGGAATGVPPPPPQVREDMRLRWRQAAEYYALFPAEVLEAVDGEGGLYPSGDVCA